MRIITEARTFPVAADATAAPWWLWLGLALGLAGLLPNAHAQVTVKTLGGGPIILDGPANGFVDGATLQESQFSTPSGLALDAAGLLYVADRDNGAVRQLDVQADAVTTLITGLHQPVALAFGEEDVLYVASQGDGTVRKFDHFGNLLNTYTGFTQPTALGVDGATVYVTELGGALKRISPEGAITIVTTGFTQPRGLAVLDSTTLAVSENHAIRRLNLETLRADYLAGTNAPGLTNGAGYLARFNQPHQIARAPNGGLVVADRLNQCVRAVDASGTTRTLYGVRSNQWSSPFPGWQDGDVKTAEASEPVGVAVGRDGTVYTTEVFYHLIREVTSSVTDTNITNVVASVTISPGGATTNNPVLVTLQSPTGNADLWYRVATTNDLTPPTPGGTDSVRYEGPFLLTTSGSLFVRGFKPGFLPSELARAYFAFTVGDPVISPSGASANNPVIVTLSSDTAGAQLRWTIDGGEPTTNSALYTQPFALSTNGSLKVKGFRDSFTPSATVTAGFDLVVSTPVVSPESGTYVDAVAVVIISATTNASFHYTLDGSVPTTNSPVSAGTLAFTTNVTLTLAAFLDGFMPSAVVAREYSVRVDAPVMFPESGYFPNGTTLTLTVQRPDALIYYTLDGRDPTPSDFLYTGPFTVRSPTTDLRGFRARAFAPGAEPSLIVSGRPVVANSIGVPHDLVAGIGSTVVVPVVVNLTTNDVLRSLQFRVEVSPRSPTTPVLTHPLRALDVSTNDFIPVASPAEQGQVARLSSSGYSIDGTQGIIITAIGTNANFVARNFATVALLAVSVPTTANVNDTYTIDVLEPSATSDGQQQSVALTRQPARTITVANVAYVVGDAAPSVWYNAGDFGDGNLANNDVNPAFYASLGIRVPYDFTDVFNALDVFPEDISGLPGGDGQIRFLDWQRILIRSLHRDANNWQRAWTTGGVRMATRASLPSAVMSATYAEGISGQLWQAQAVLGGVSQANVQPGSEVKVPVYVNVATGAKLAGLQFRAVIQPQGDAPALQQAAQFQPASGLTSPLTADGLPREQVATAWSPLLNPLAAPLENSNHLGYVSFVVPASAPAGSSYIISFANADGSPDLDTQYDFSTSAAGVWVQAPAVPLTDLSGPASGFKLSWFAAQGRRYVVEAATDSVNGAWTPIANLIGAGRVEEFIDQDTQANAKFYRVVVQP